MAMILSIGLTPTVQRTLRFGRLNVGEVNRAKEVWTTASGKGVNVARVLTRLGGSGRVAQILGGDSGRFVASALESEGVAQQTIWAMDDAPTRTCCTLLEADGRATELVEEARQVEPHDLALIEAACRTAILEARAVCLSGSLPPGVPPEFYGRMTAEARANGLPVIVDTQKAPLAAALAARPLLVKPNREEAAATLGFSLSGDAEADARTAIAALISAGAGWALVSLGKIGALLGNGDTLYRLTPPTVQAVNPIGSGDSLAAGLLYAHVVLGKPIPEACAFGTACGAANCLTPTSGVVHPEDVERLLPQVQLRRL